MLGDSKVLNHNESLTKIYINDINVSGGIPMHRLLHTNLEISMLQVSAFAILYPTSGLDMALTIMVLAVISFLVAVSSIFFEEWDTMMIASNFLALIGVYLFLVELPIFGTCFLLATMCSGVTIVAIARSEGSKESRKALFLTSLPLGIGVLYGTAHLFLDKVADEVTGHPKYRR